jgi:hypothetical protein
MKEIIQYSVLITLYSVIIVGFLAILYGLLRAFSELLTLIFKQLRVFNAVVEYFWYRKEFKEFLKNR